MRVTPPSVITTINKASAQHLPCGAAVFASVYTDRERPRTLLYLRGEGGELSYPLQDVSLTGLPYSLQSGSLLTHTALLTALGVGDFC